MLKDEKGVYFEEGFSGSVGIYSVMMGMWKFKFCFNIVGDIFFLNCLFDVIVSYCIFVIISDDIEVLFEDELDYFEFCVFIKLIDVFKEKFVINLLRNVSEDEWIVLWKRLKVVVCYFEY